MPVRSGRGAGTGKPWHCSRGAGSSCTETRLLLPPGPGGTRLCGREGVRHGTGPAPCIPTRTSIRVARRWGRGTGPERPRRFRPCPPAVPRPRASGSTAQRCAGRCCMVGGRAAIHLAGGPRDRRRPPRLTRILRRESLACRLPVTNHGSTCVEPSSISV